MFDSWEILEFGWNLSQISPNAFCDASFDVVTIATSKLVNTFERLRLLFTCCRVGVKVLCWIVQSENNMMNMSSAEGSSQVFDHACRIPLLRDLTEDQDPYERRPTNVSERQRRLT